VPDPSHARLLIVDDEALNRELLRRVLQREYSIEEAEDAAQALQVLQECGDHVRLILCDHLMPGLSGTQLAEQVRERWPHIIFMLLTGYDDDPDVREAEKSGLLRHVVAKPWRGQVLKGLIAAELAGAPSGPDEPT